jgi:hypothetical protein
MALNPKMHVTLTVEELEDIKETAQQRADEMEWQLRVELQKIREIERNLSRILGEASQVPVEKAAAPAPKAAPVAKPALAPVAKAAPAPAPPPAPAPVVGKGTPSYGTPLPPTIAVAPPPAPAATPVKPAWSGKSTPPPLPPAARKLTGLKPA